MERWSVDRVIALAPDAASEVAGRKLANPGPWQDVGFTDPLLFGACQGSGKTPYQVAIDTAGPTYKCSCPSRKFPCKHVLGLLFLWAEGRVDPTTGLSEFAAEWASRQQAAQTRASQPPKEQTDVQKRQAAARAAQREERVAAGLDELDQWLADQVRGGLAHLTDVRLEAMAARMVDAQVPGVANRLRGLQGVTRSRAERLLSELSLLRLLVQGYRNADALPGDLRATVRSHLGFTTPRDDVHALPGVADTWVVVGMRDSDDEQVPTRRLWLRGQRTGRWALVLQFAPVGQQFDASLIPELATEATLHFYPGRPPLRALVGRRENDEHHLSGWLPDAGGVAAAVSEYRAALAADPWLTSWPAMVRGRACPANSWSLVDDQGERVTLVGAARDLWQLLALSGGQPTTVFGELSPAGLRPTSLIDERARLVAL